MILNQTTAKNVDQFRPKTNSTVSPLDRQETPHLLWKMNLPITSHKILPVEPVLSLLDSVHTLSNCNTSIHDPVQ